MKLVQVIKPVNEDKRRELERELEVEKRKFKSASERAAKAVRTDLDLARWTSKNALELSMLIWVGGIVLARFVRARRDEKIQRRRQERKRVHGLPADAVGLSPEDFANLREGTLLKPTTHPDYP